jgi:hypothetical protein
VGIMLVTSALNWGIWGPRCLQAMIDQAHQGEAKKSKAQRGVAIVLLIPKIYVLTNGKSRNT